MSERRRSARLRPEPEKKGETRKTKTKTTQKKKITSQKKKTATQKTSAQKKNSIKNQPPTNTNKKKVEVEFFALNKDEVGSSVKQQIYKLLRENFPENIPTLLGTVFFARLTNSKQIVSIAMLEHVLDGDRKNENEYWIYNVATSKKYTGQGFAQRLMRYVTQWFDASSKGPGIWLDTQQTNKAAQAVYTKVGFKVVESETSNKAGLVVYFYKTKKK